MLKILPPAWFLLFLGVALLLHLNAPDTHFFDLSSAANRALGIALFLGGMYLSLKASKQFAENKTEIIPTSPTNRVLVTDGAYQYTRNPMYLGMILTLAGIAFFTGTLPMFLAALAQFTVLNFFFIPYEEAKLERIFGQQYLSYKQKVRRWV